jgi:hypothetical protein
MHYVDPFLVKPPAPAAASHKPSQAAPIWKKDIDSLLNYIE